MLDCKFSVIDHPENNFLKCKNVESELLWGDEPEGIFLSVVLITHKRFDMVKQALNSVCGQRNVSYGWEIVLMDNDPEEDRLLPYIKKLNNPRIRYYRNKRNLEHEGNVNRGIELAKGKWVSLLHDDDLLAPDYLVLIEQYIKACEGWKRPLAYIRAKHFSFCDEKELPFYRDRKIEPSFFIRRELWIETLLRGFGPTFVNSCGSVINREAFIEAGGYNDKLNPIGDATLGLIFMKKGYSIYATERVLGYYRQGENLSSQKGIILSFIEADYLLREYLYSRNAMTRLFGRLFREAQFAESVDRRMNMVEKYQKIDARDVFSMEEIEVIHPYRKSKIARIFLRFVRRLVVIIYRQSHLVWREG